MRQIYICGDSFSSVDPDFSGFHWTEKLADLLGSEYKVINLSRPCSSNFFIRVQVDCAIKESADYIIFHGSSSTRDEVALRPTQYVDNFFDRFVNLSCQDNTKKDLTCYSLHSIDNTTLFTQYQQDLLLKYQTEFFNIDIGILKNQFLIESTLFALTQSNIPFKFDQGGFEHPKFSNSDKKYFSPYTSYFSKINLWDYADTTIRKPLFHIVDEAVHIHVADYYSKEIINSLEK